MSEDSVIQDDSLMHDDADGGSTNGSYRKAVFTGMFDPFTLGHLDVVQRGRLLFDHLVVGIGMNPTKRAMFDVEERVRLVKRVVDGFDNVSVEPFDGLTVSFVREIGARVILRGVRTLSDMEYEFSMTLTNQKLDPNLETVFLMADGEFSHISSSVIKQVAQYAGADALRKLVPAPIIPDILARIQHPAST